MSKEPRILLIEDSPTDAELEIRELKRAGLHVACRLVDTEAAFRNALREFQPDVIISDFSMPHFDGMWALEIARVLAPDVPFIFVSGTIGEDYAIRALKNGATDYVLKNNLVRLPPAVERALQEAQERLVLRRAQEALRETEERFRAFMQHLPGRASIRDRDGRYTFVNEAWQRAFNLRAAKVVGRTYEELWPPERATGIEVIHREVLDTNKPVSRVFRVGTDDDYRWWLSTHFPIPDTRGNTALIGTVSIDITERKIQEEKIARLTRIHAVLSGINSAIVRIRDRQKLFEEACRIAVEHGNFGMAWIGALDPAAQEVTPVAWAGIEADDYLAGVKSSLSETLPTGRGILAKAIRTQRPVFDNDITADPQMGGPRRRAAIERGYRSVIVLPLIVESQVFGNLSLFAKEPNFFDDEEIKLLSELAGDISFALEHMENQRKIEKLSRVRAISSRINAAIVRIREHKALLEETCRIAREDGKFEMVWIGMVNAEHETVEPVAWTGFSEAAAHAVSWATVSAAQGTLGESIRTRRPAVRNDIETGLTTGKLRQEALQKGCLSTVCLPLVVGERVSALIALFAPGRGFFDEDELALFEEVASDVSFALDHIDKEERLNYLAYYDVLTGLPNRTLFNDRLVQRIGAARDEEQSFSVMMLNVERFRLVNDTFGRQVGDELLRGIARRLKSVLHGADLLAHFGGDEYAIATHRAGEPGVIAHVLDQVMTSVSGEPFGAGGGELRLAVRAGVTVYPSDGADVETLVRNAEAALNDARETGQRYVFYAPQMNARIAGQLKLENELRRAVQEEQFVLHYQPRFELSGGRITGLEALIRWRHPDRGLVMPGEFIQLLEDTGLILEAGRWALKRAALDHAAWSAAGRRPPRIAVNVSPVQLRRKDFVEYVRDALAAVDKAADCIDVEITESMLMEDIEGSIGKLKAVQSMGLYIAVDDFGTGYSSLSYLARLPINSLKIDRSFVIQMNKGPEQMAIVSTVISLARALNLKVVAEGVETEEQANLLRLLRCDEAQGYLFSRPIPPEEMERLLPLA